MDPATDGLDGLPMDEDEPMDGEPQPSGSGAPSNSQAIESIEISDSPCKAGELIGSHATSGMSAGEKYDKLASLLKIVEGKINRSGASSASMGASTQAGGQWLVKLWYLHLLVSNVDLCFLKRKLQKKSKPKHCRIIGC